MLFCPVLYLIPHFSCAAEWPLMPELSACLGRYMKSCWKWINNRWHVSCKSSGIHAIVIWNKMACRYRNCYNCYLFHPVCWWLFTTIISWFRWYSALSLLFREEFDDDVDFVGNSPGVLHMKCLILSFSNASAFRKYFAIVACSMCFGWPLRYFEKGKLHKRKTLNKVYKIT